MNGTSPSNAKEISLQSVQAFFISYGLPESQKLLWQWLRITVSDSFGQQDSVTRQNLLSFYENLLKLVETSHHLLQQCEGQEQEHSLQNPIKNIITAPE